MQSKPEKTSSMDKWRCQKCFFDNLVLLPDCEICEEPRQRQPKKIDYDSSGKTSSEPGIQCSDSKCGHFNSLTRDTCEECGKQLFPDSENEDLEGSIAKVLAPKAELQQCRKCGYENDPTNAYCVNCQKRFVPQRILKKSIRPRRAVKRAVLFRMGAVQSCPTCGQSVRIIDNATGEIDICMVCEERSPSEVSKSLCVFCDNKINSSEDKDHDRNCEERQKFFNRETNFAYNRLTDLQYQTITYMQLKCQKLHFRKEKQLVERVKKLGYSAQDLSNLHYYLIHYAPINIHMHVNTHFHFFVKDTHYRNQFQTNKSSGSLSHSSRMNWEDRMFDRKHQHASGFERVKYGAMNFTNDPKGIRCCSGYGQSYFILKSHVRDRCTVTDMDSSSSSATLGTLRFMFHVLMKLSDAELRCAFEGSKGKEMKSNVVGTYKEIQIHGPVQFAKDIQRVYISKDELKMGDAKALLEQVKTFCSKHKLEYQLFQNDKPAAPVFGLVHGPRAIATDQKSEDRIVGDKKQLTDEDLRPPAPVPAVGLGGGGLGAFGGGGGLFSSIGPSSAAHFGASHFSFGAPVAFSAPRPVVPPKKKEYGVDYI